MFWDGIMKAKALLEMNLVGDVKDNQKQKSFYKYFGRKRRIKEHILPFGK